MVHDAIILKYYTVLIVVINSVATAKKSGGAFLRFEGFYLKCTYLFIVLCGVYCT